MRLNSYFPNKQVLQSTCLIGLFLFSACSRGNKSEEVVRTRYYHSYGPEVNEASWKEQGMNGEVVEHLKNGIEVRKMYADNVLHGSITWSYPNSSIVHRYQEYEHGKLICFGVNYENGTSELQEELHPNKVRIIRGWYEDSSPRFIEEWHSKTTLTNATYFTDVGEVEAQIQSGNGTRIDRSGNGTLQFREQYVQGQLALQEEFYPNGTAKYATCMKNGVKHGITHTYAETGQPISIEHWNNGRLDGITTDFDHGLKVAERPYKNGIREGVELRFRPGTDDIVARISWHNDMKHGASLFIFPDQEITEWYWKNGKLSEEQFYIRQRQLEMTTGKH